jgi:hypothetical protein
MFSDLFAPLRYDVLSGSGLACDVIDFYLLDSCQTHLYISRQVLLLKRDNKRLKFHCVFVLVQKLVDNLNVIQSSEVSDVNPALPLELLEDQSSLGIVLLLNCLYVAVLIDVLINRLVFGLELDAIVLIEVNELFTKLICHLFVAYFTGESHHRSQDTGQVLLRDFVGSIRVCKGPYGVPYFLGIYTLWVILLFAKV